MRLHAAKSAAVAIGTYHLNWDTCSNRPMDMCLPQTAVNQAIKHERVVGHTAVPRICIHMYTRSYTTWLRALVCAGLPVCVRVRNGTLFLRARVTLTVQLAMLTAPYSSTIKGPLSLSRLGATTSVHPGLPGRTPMAPEASQRTQMITVPLPMDTLEHKHRRQKKNTPQHAAR